MNKLETEQALGVFDSGIGGLSVANAIISHLPREQIIYFGDSARLPYGTQSQEVIKSYCFQITDVLLQKNCKAIVVACNTATAAALNALRLAWPEVPFIGMEPAVKPGAEATKTGKIGVLATAGTFSSQRYESLTKKFATDIIVLENPCIGLVELIEHGKINSQETEALLASVLNPMLEQGVDTFILGCTHYPFVQSLIQKIIGPDKTIINPAPAVAKQVARVLKEKQLLNHTLKSEHLFFTSGDQQFFTTNLDHLFKGKYLLNQLILN